eukprot:TRINITY_DN747_c1_g1_i3.p1 TRINITY_DN747_c1_g1~~TRINITY_DN747_c1_g1_i3.p1  ORF type:complete len:436 (+),score=115.25 TRINITY_DN747_c1_g1_i3:187-1308(+)
MTKTTATTAAISTATVQLIGWSTCYTLPAHGREPTHLVILQHGLSGTDADLDVLKEKLIQCSASVQVLVHSARANFGKTTDGVEQGGNRLADEIQNLILQYRSLTHISLVGNSLGGLYTRFAIAKLWSPKTKKVAGLIPAAFVTIGCPHLGVRKFTFLPIPSFLHQLAPVLVGQTGADLFLLDASGSQPRPLLSRMADPDDHGSFLSALSAFKDRSLYANLWGDFMVPFGTAAFEPSWGSGFQDEAMIEDFVKRSGATVLDESVLQRRQDGVAAQVDTGSAPAVGGGAPAATSATSGNGDAEIEMAKCLSACGWKKFAVGFANASTLFPMAHNKIAALSRDGWRKAAFSWIEGAEDGCKLMLHIANYITASVG